MDLDLGPGAQFTDGVWRNLGIHMGHGPGIASVHRDSLEWAANYLKQAGDPTANAAQRFLDSDPGQNHAADFNNSVEASAIVLKALALVRTNGGASNSSATDMAVIWGAYRAGVKGLLNPTPAPTLKTVISQTPSVAPARATLPKAPATPEPSWEKMPTSRNPTSITCGATTAEGGVRHVNGRPFGVIGGAGEPPPYAPTEPYSLAIGVTTNSVLRPAWMAAISASVRLTASAPSRMVYSRSNCLVAPGPILAMRP